MSRIIVVGGGIVGLSTARAAMQRGHEVTLVERGPLPNPQAASWDAHRMIRHHYGAAAGYARMVRDAFGAWDRVWRDLGRDHHHRSGAIAIGVRPDDYAHRTEQVFRDEGIAYERLERDALERLCPQYKLPAGAMGILTEEGGPLFADRIVADLAALVRAGGVTVLANSTVIAVDGAMATATLADGTVLRADAVVVAAGAWVRRLVPEFAGLPVMRQALAYVRPPQRFADAWATGPALAAYGDHGGYTLPGVRGTDLKFGNGPHRRAGDPDRDGFATTDDEPRAVIDAFGDILHDIAGYEPLRMVVGYYVMDETRRFRVVARDRAVIVTNCDGQMFKFGPLVGERIVAAIEDGGTAALDDWGQGK